jgi:GR25 family glycosyltransferase involved in LPS biosynthesis
MQSFLINLDRNAERLARFRAANGFLSNVQRFAAIDGGALDRQKLVSQGLIDAQLCYTNGDLGCVLSHMSLWETSLKNDAALTVFEDDAVVNRHFAQRSAALLNGLPRDWDYVSWGWNFDSVLAVDLLPGISQTVMTCDQESLRGRLHVFQDLNFDVAAYPLLCAFGTMAYSISPGGARKLFGSCRPLRPFKMVIGDPNFTVENKSIDVMLCALYPLLRAFVCIPPLVVSPNVRDRPPPPAQ